MSVAIILQNIQILTMKKIFLILLVCGLAQHLPAQFGSIMSRVNDRIADKVADAIVDEIIKKTFKPVNESADEALKKSFEDSLGTSEVDYNKMGKAYGEFLAGMNGAYDKMPPSYDFDVVNDIEITDGKKVTPTKMYLSKSGNQIGYESINKNETSLVVYDIKNDIMVMYTTDKKGKKKGQVLPSMMKFASSIANDKVEEEMENVKIKKSGGSRTFAGYKCEGYEVETSSMTNQVYIAKDFPVSHMQAYGNFLQQFTPAAKSYEKDMAKGMVMYSQSKEKNGKSTSTYEVKNVSLKGVTINKADYSFDGYDKK